MYSQTTSQSPLTDTEWGGGGEAVENARLIKGVSVLSGLNLEKMYGRPFPIRGGLWLNSRTNNEYNIGGLESGHRGCCNLPLTSRQRKHFVWQNIVLFFLYKETIRMAHGEILSCRTYILNNAGLCSKTQINCWTSFTIDGSGTTCVPPYPSVLARSRIVLMAKAGVLRSNWCTVDAFTSFPKLPSSRFSGHRGFYNRVWRSCLSKITTSTITCPSTDNIGFKWINWVF